MTDKAKAFYEKVSADEALKNELDAIIKGVNPEDQIPAVITFAKDKGIELSKEDFAADNAELSLDELEAVTGAGGCGCGLYGSGGGDGLSCKCWGVGTGYVGSCMNSQGGCACPAAGAGATNRH